MKTLVAVEDVAAAVTAGAGADGVNLKPNEVGARILGVVAWKIFLPDFLVDVLDVPVLKLNPPAGGATLELLPAGAAIPPKVKAAVAGAAGVAVKGFWTAAGAAPPSWAPNVIVLAEVVLKRLVTVDAPKLVPKAALARRPADSPHDHTHTHF